MLQSDWYIFAPRSAIGPVLKAERFIKISYLTILWIWLHQRVWCRRRDQRYPSTKTTVWKSELGLALRSRRCISAPQCAIWPIPRAARFIKTPYSSVLRRLPPQDAWFISREQRYPSTKNIQYRIYVKVSSIWSARVALYLAPRLAILSITSAARFTKSSVFSCKYDRVSASAIYFESRQKADTSYEFDCDRIAVSPRLGEIFCSLKG